MEVIRIASRALTWASLTGALACSVAWWLTGADLEPAVNTLLILSAISGLFIERWVRRLSRRRELLHALLHELLVNQRILENPLLDRDAELPNEPQALPPLVLGVVESALASGALMDRSDRELFRHLHLWRARARQLNRRMEITEDRMNLDRSPDLVGESLEVLRYGRTLKRARREMDRLLGLLTTLYPSEVGPVPTKESFLDHSEGE